MSVATITKLVCFYLGLGFLFTHELDAIANSEWRVLPLTSWLSDEVGYKVFVFAHIPIFAGIIALLVHASPLVKQRTMLTISSFLLLHGVLHWAFSSHAAYEFAGFDSNLLIFGGAFFGLVHLGLEFITRRSNI